MTTTLHPRRPVEDRLTAALQARADLVRPEDLTTRTLPGARPSRRRGWYAAAGVAAAVTGVLALTQLHHKPAPRLAGMPPNATTSFRADLDGDGRDDRVSIDDSGLLTMDTNDGSPVSVSLPQGSLLLGPMRGMPIAGGGGRASIVVAAAKMAGHEWAARLIGGDGRELTSLIDTAIPQITEFTTVWVSHGVLYAGQWDESGPVSTQLRVDARRYDLGIDTIATRDVGLLCWDRSVDPFPRACTSLGEFGPDVGSAEGLPALFPAQPINYMVPGGSPWISNYGQVTLRSVGRHKRVTLAEGTNPPVSAELPDRTAGVAMLDLGPGLLLVTYGNGVGVAADVYQSTAGGLAKLPTRSAVPLMSGSPLNDDAEVDFWVSHERVLYSSRDLLADDGRVMVWRWSVVGAGSDAALQSTKVGVVCVDRRTDPVRFGRCPAQ